MLPSDTEVRPKRGDTADLEDLRKFQDSRLEGKIGTWAAMNSYGFLLSPENFSGGLFVHKADMTDMTAWPAPGVKVTFKLRFNFDREGNDRCCAVQVLDPTSTIAKKELGHSTASAPSSEPIELDPEQLQSAHERVATLMAGRPCEEALWVELFLEGLQRERVQSEKNGKKRIFEAIVHSTKNQTEDPVLSKAATRMLANWKDVIAP